MSLWSTGGLFSLQNEPRSWPPYFTTLSFCVWNLNTLRLDLQRHIGQKLQGIYGESDGCPIFVSVITRKSIIIMPKIGYFGIFRFPPHFLALSGYFKFEWVSFFYFLLSLLYFYFLLLNQPIWGGSIWGGSLDKNGNPMNLNFMSRHLESHEFFVFSKELEKWGPVSQKQKPLKKRPPKDFHQQTQSNKPHIRSGWKETPLLKDLPFADFHLNENSARMIQKWMDSPFSKLRFKYFTFQKKFALKLESPYKDKIILVGCNRQKDKRWTFEVK